MRCREIDVRALKTLPWAAKSGIIPPISAAVWARKPDKGTHMIWNTENSASLYGINHWGDGYFFVGDNGEVMVRPNGQSDTAVSLYALVQDLHQHGQDLPMLLRFPIFCKTGCLSCARRLNVPSINTIITAATRRFIRLRLISKKAWSKALLCPKTTKYRLGWRRDPSRS